MKKINNITGIKVPFFPASEEYSFLKSELIEALDEVGSSGVLILGPKVQELEKRLAGFTKTQYCVGCASGTDALTLALKSLRLESNDEVIVPANSYPTIFGVALSGVKPVLVDVNSKTGNIDPSSVQKKITSRTKAIVAVHLYGQSANVGSLVEICREKNIILIEDCAQAFGATHKGRPVGSFGTLSTFSFYPTKNLGAYGDGGAIVTNDLNLFNRLKLLRMYGERSRYASEELGNNSRLDELQAAFLLKKLNYFNEWIMTRKKLAGIYHLGLKHIKELELPFIDENNDHTYHLFPIKSNKRDELKNWLLSQEIETGIHYPNAIHQVITFKSLGNLGDFPNSETWAKEELSLPLHPFLSEVQIKHVVNKVSEFFINR